MPEKRNLNWGWGVWGILSLTSGLSAWLVGGLLSIGIGIVAVGFGFWGTRKGQRLSMTGMIVGSFPIIFANLINLGAIPLPASLESDRSHLVKSINASIAAFDILKKNDLAESDRVRLVQRCRKALGDAQKVNLEIMEKQVPGFSAHYRDEFMKGMESLMQGYENSELSMKLQGGLLLDKWGRWQRENQEAFNRLKEPDRSLISLIRGVGLS